MPPRRETIASLKRLQAKVRSADEPEASPGRSGRVPEDLATESVRSLFLTAEESKAFDQAWAALSVDLSFEHLTEQDARKAV
jgi:hypothetical protein